MTTTRPRIALASLILALAASSAAADAHLELQRYAGWIGELKAQYSRALGTEDDPIAACRKAIDEARAEGMRGDEVLRADGYQHVRGARQVDGSWQLAFRDAGNVCEAAAYWLKVAQLQGTLSEAQRSLDWLKMIDLASNHEDNAAKLASIGRRCHDAIDRARTDRVAATLELEVWGMPTTHTLTVGAARAELCAPLIQASETFAQSVAKERAARWERIAAPYKAAGIEGDRLAYLVEHDGYAKYGVGGAELTNVKQLAQAKVVFEVLSGQGVVTVRRREFKGDALAGTTTKDYERRPGPRAFR